METDAHGRAVTDPFDEIARWLTSLGLEQYAEAFREHQVLPDLLASLTAEDLRDIGVVAVGHRRRLLGAIAARAALPAFSSAAPPAPLPPAPAPAPAAESGWFAPTDRTAESGGERRRLTLLFCDMVGSTEIASRSDPEDMQEILARFHSACAAAVERNGGYIVQYLGDGLMALFGYPQSRENEAEWALRAALAIRQAVAQSASRRAVRIGVATGLVVIGDLSDGGLRNERTVVGEIPNLAARFQAVAQPGEIVCGDITRRLAGALFDYEALPPQSLKGFATPIIAYRVLDERAVESRFQAVRQNSYSRLIGRETEIGLLLDRWATACEGEGQVTLIGGDPGIGKSRLLQAFLQQAERREHQRVVLQCSPPYRDSALFPAIRQLEMAAGLRSSASAAERRAQLAPLLAALPGAEALAPALHRLLGITDAADESDELPERARRRSLDAWVEWIALLGRQQPVLVVVEDAHWSDPSTLELVDLLVQRIPNLPVLLLVTYRLEFDCPWARVSYATSLKLNRLSRAQSLVLVGSVAGGRPLAPELAGRIVDKTDGIPLFIEEVVRSLLESGGEQPDGGAGLPVRVPDSLTDTLLSRLDRDSNAKRVAQIASVIGREFPLSLLSAVSDMEPGAIESGLVRLIESGLIAPLGTADQEDGRYLFKHGLLQEATYDTLLLRRRRKLHRRIAETLEAGFEASGEKRPEMVARHYEGAGIAELAAQRWLAAGQQALQLGSYGEALQHLSAGLAVLQHLPEESARQRLELALQMAKAQALRSARFTNGEEALAACQRARLLAESLGDVGRQVEGLRLELGINVNRPDADGIERVASEFRRIAEEHDNRIAEVLAEQSAGCVAFLRGAPAAAEVHLRASLEAAERVTDKAALTNLQFPTTALCYLAICCALQGRLASGRQLVAQAVGEAKLHSRFAISLACTNGLIFCRLIGEETMTAELRGHLEVIAEARGVAYWIGLTAFHQGFDRLRLAAAAQPAKREAGPGDGEVEASVALMRGAIATFRAQAVEIEIPFYLSLLAQGLIRAGRSREALEVLEEAVSTVQRTHEVWCLPELLRLKAEAVAADEAAAAETLLREAIATAAAQGSLLLELRATASLARIATAGSRIAAAKRLAQLRDMLEPGFDGPDTLAAGAAGVLEPAPASG